MSEPAKLSEEQKQAQLAAMRIVRAYRAVLGTNGMRSSAQLIVLDDMKKRFGYLAPAFQLNDHGDMPAMPAAFRDGRRSVVVDLFEILDPVSEDDQTTQPEVIK
jgi:hypothetical protein